MSININWMILFCRQDSWSMPSREFGLQSIYPAPLRNTFPPHLHFEEKKKKRYYKTSIAVDISCSSEEYFITTLPAKASCLFWKAIHAIHDSNVQNTYLTHSHLLFFRMAHLRILFMSYTTCHKLPLLVLFKWKISGYFLMLPSG